jgi:undecaprenyl-phosphate 4-deoxy-4-formamido-L-arabinose transferase
MPKPKPSPEFSTRSVSVVVPVYNSAATLAELTARVHKVLTPLVQHLEIIFVNDGSRDNSWQVICGLAELYQSVRGLDHMRNYGQHNALLAGVRAARNDVIVTMDDDLQHPPEEIPKLLAKLEEGYDVVYGPPLQQRHGLWRDTASKITKLAYQSALGVDIARIESSFRAFRTQLRDAFLGCQEPYVNLDALLTWGTTRFGAVWVRHDPRRDGVSNYTFDRLLTHAINMMTSFSTLPLRLASLIGFVFTLFGVSVLVYVIGLYLVGGGSVPGFPFLASTIAIFSGAQLFALGIMGEYLARMHFRNMGRPLSVIRSTTPRPGSLLLTEDGQALRVYEDVYPESAIER